MKHILRCPKCQKYTMKDSCSCGGKCINPKPPKYSPDDKYSEYRRTVKRDDLIKGDLL